MADTAPEEDREKVVQRFRQITGLDMEASRSAISSANGNLEVALERYYSTIEEIADVDSPFAPAETDEGQTSTKESETPPQKKAEKSRFGTLAGLKTAEGSDSSEEEEGQAYYAGGSQHSGQQVLGPPSRKKKKDIISDILKSAQRIGTEVIDTTKPSSQPREMFTGTGYRLGQTEDDTEVLPSASSGSGGTATVTLKLWRDGFNLDDGPLRSYDDPTNKDFLDSVREGVIPQELTRALVGNQVLNLDLEDHHDERFVPPATPRRIKPFTGAGHKLGSPTPSLLNTSVDESEGDKKKSLVLDPDRPTVKLIIRLANGTRLEGQFNPHHTIADVRNYITMNHPEFIGQSYYLRTTLPPVNLQDDQTLEDLGLNNSVITMLLH